MNGEYGINDLITPDAKSNFNTEISSSSNMKKSENYGNFRS